MAHYLLAQGLLDEAWLDAHCVGWSEVSMASVVEAGDGAADYYEPAYNKTWGDTDGTEPAVPANSSYKSYILGLADGVEKTPAWASEITGVPEAVIKSFATQLMNESPAMVIQGWGPQRHSLGGNNTRAIGLITILTQNIGVVGGGSAAREAAGSVGISMDFWDSTFPANPVTHTISNYAWPQAIKDHTVMTGNTWGVRGLANENTALPQPIKMELCR